MKQTIEFGIVGCGMIADTHAEAIRGIPGAILRGVTDRDGDRAARFAEKHGVFAYASYEEMLADEALDAVCVCTPSFLHAENALAALNAGKHVALEKPMALTVEDAQKVDDACVRTGRKLTVISQFRFAEDVRRVKGLLDDGAFGRVTLCELRMPYYRSESYYALSPWKGRLACDGGGALMNQGIHGIDLLLYLCGDVEEVAGKIRTLSHKIEAEDTAAAVLTFENGALGTVTASTCAFPGFDRTIGIYGDKGFVILREGSVEKMLTRDGKAEERPAKSHGTAGDAAIKDCELHRRQLTNLVEAIRGRAELLVFNDQKDGMKALKLIREIYR